MSYTLEKRYSPRTGITQMLVSFRWPQNCQPKIFWDDFDNEQKGIIEANVRGIVTDINYMPSKANKKGKMQVYEKASSKSIILSLPEWAAIHEKTGELYMQPSPELQQAAKEAFTFAHHHKGKEIFASSGTLIKAPMEQMPKKVKYIIKETSLGVNSQKIWDITKKEERQASATAQSEGELTKKLYELGAHESKRKVSITKRKAPRITPKMPKISR